MDDREAYESSQIIQAMLIDCAGEEKKKRGRKEEKAGRKGWASTILSIDVFFTLGETCISGFHVVPVAVRDRQQYIGLML